MKRVSLILVAIGLTVMSAFGQKIETRTVSGFTGIDASSAFDITVARGGTESLAIEADDEVMPYVRSEVRNGVLRLYLDNNKIRNIKTLKASVVMKNLDMVALSGACKLTAGDLFTPERFKGECSGASKIALNLHAGQLNIETSGASKIQLKANVTGDAKFNVSGACKLYAELKATNVKVDSGGANSIELTGSATNLKIDLSGTSHVDAENFTVKNVSVESSGAGKVTVHVTDALKVQSSGASSVRYKGSPTIDVSSSGASKVKSL